MEEDRQELPIFEGKVLNVRRKIYRHIRNNHLDTSGHYIKLLFLIGVFVLIPTYVLSDFDLQPLLGSIWFLILYIVYFLKDSRDNYIMDILSAVVEEEIREANNSSVKLKLKKQSRNGFFYSSTLGISSAVNEDHYKPYLNTKISFSSSNSDSIDFPVLKNHHWGFSTLIKRYGIDYNNLLQKIPYDFDLEIIGESYWKKPYVYNSFIRFLVENTFIGFFYPEFIFRSKYNKQTIYICKTEMKNSELKYSFLTSNELFLFKISSKSKLN